MALLISPLQDILSDESQSRGSQCDQVKAILEGTEQIVRRFLPKGLGISCIGVGDDQMAQKMIAGIGKIGKIGKSSGSGSGESD
jgi:hypothetical protein